MDFRPDLNHVNANQILTEDTHNPHNPVNLKWQFSATSALLPPAGAVANDNLVLMDYCNRLRSKGMVARETIIEAGVVRFRPILLTSVTTIVGLIPMMPERSIQAAFLQPVVVALAFGMLFAFFVTLLMVPSLYGIGLDIGESCSRIRALIYQKLKRDSHSKLETTAL